MTQSGELAHVHFKHATGNNYDEIRMGVQVGGRRLKLDSARVADILLHEIIHTLCPQAGHRGAFRYIAQHMGLEGKMTATVAGDDLALIPRGKRGKGSRSIKCQCTNLECLFTMRTTRKWIERAGFVLSCPICETVMQIEGMEGVE